MKPINIRMEYGKTQPGEVCIIETQTPLISWAISAADGEICYGWRAQVLRCGKTVWDSGIVNGDEQSVRPEALSLEPGKVYTFSIALLDENGEEKAEERQDFCNGAVSLDGKWLTDEEERAGAVLDFSTDFSADDVESACLFVCGLGYHKIYVNDIPAFDSPLNPAYSQYDKRSYYTVLPGVEKYLTKGTNHLEIRVASGWRNPKNICYNLVGRIAEYVGPTVLCAELRLFLKNGEIKRILTDESWKLRYDAVTYSDIFDGERFDASRQNAHTTEKVKVLAGSPAKVLRPQTLEPVLEQKIFEAQSVSEVAPGVWLADFGQNIAGVCRLSLPSHLAPGEVITMRHSEFLDEDGRLYLPQNRNAESMDTYTASTDGNDLSVWQPEFTYHGFRYAEISGYPGALTRNDICAVLMHTDVEKDSSFTSGSALLNAIAKNCRMTEKDNIHSILTDCPQRDERMGWMNDATVRFESVPYLFDVGRLFPKVVRDFQDVQDEEGRITCTAPFAFGGRPADPVCSSYLVAGWEAWLHTGNLEILREGYDGWKRWDEFLGRCHNEGDPIGIVNYSYYGDWAGPSYACVNEEFACSAVTPGILMSTGFHYFNAKLLSRIAALLGEEEESAREAEKADEIRSSFLKTWYNPETGIVGTGSQGCQAFALWLDILPEEGRAEAAKRMHEDLVEKEYRFTTGNLCTRYLLEQLTRYGYVEDAMKILLREEYPSFGYMIQNEATTIWERFELKKNCTMNSHNHPMHASSYRWFYAYLLGLTPVDAAWKTFRVEPKIPEKLLSAQGTVETPYGDIAVRWVKRYGKFHLYVTVPFGTVASVVLPNGKTEEVRCGFHHFEDEL